MRVWNIKACKKTNSSRDGKMKITIMGLNARDLYLI